MKLFVPALLVTTAAALAAGQNVSVVRNILVTDITNQFSAEALSQRLNFGYTSPAGALAFNGNGTWWAKPAAATSFTALVGPSGLKIGYRPGDKTFEYGYPVGDDGGFYLVVGTQVYYSDFRTYKLLIDTSKPTPLKLLDGTAQSISNLSLGVPYPDSRNHRALFRVLTGVPRRWSVVSLDRATGSLELRAVLPTPPANESYLDTQGQWPTWFDRKGRLVYMRALGAVLKLYRLDLSTQMETPIPLPGTDSTYVLYSNTARWEFDANSGEFYYSYFSSGTFPQQWAVLQDAFEPLFNPTDFTPTYNSGIGPAGHQDYVYGITNRLSAIGTADPAAVSSGVGIYSIWTPLGKAQALFRTDDPLVGANNHIDLLNFGSYSLTFAVTANQVPVSTLHVLQVDPILIDEAGYSDSVVTLNGGNFTLGGIKPEILLNGILVPSEGVNASATVIKVTTANPVFPAGLRAQIRTKHPSGTLLSAEVPVRDATPPVRITGVAPATHEDVALSSGMQIEISGFDLCRPGEAQPGATPWLLQFARCQIKIDGSLVPVGPVATLLNGQQTIKTQIPYDLTAGEHVLTVERLTSGGAVEALSAPKSANVASLSPTMAADRLGNIILTRADGTVVTLEAPLIAGDTLIAAGTGFGQTSPFIPLGQAALDALPDGSAAMVVAPVQAWIKVMQAGTWNYVALGATATANARLPGWADVTLPFPPDLFFQGTSCFLVFKVGDQYTTEMPAPCQGNSTLLQIRAAGAKL